MLFESGKAKLAGRFPELEDELRGLIGGGGYAGAGAEPGPGGRDGVGDDRTAGEAAAPHPARAGALRGTVTGDSYR